MNSATWLEWVRRLQAISQTGLICATDPFDRERYEAIRAIAAEIMADGTGVSDASRIVDLLQCDVGYAIPGRFRSTHTSCSS